MKLSVIITVLALFPTKAFAQEALCFIQWHGHTIDLSSSICKSRDEISAANLNPLSVSNIRFSDVSIEQAADGTSLDIKGTVTNDSDKVSSLSAVKFRVIDQRTGHILTSDTATVEAGRGLGPGQQLAFSKTISSNRLGGVAITDLRVEIISDR